MWLTLWHYREQFMICGLYRCLVEPYFIERLYAHIFSSMCLLWHISYSVNLHINDHIMHINYLVIISQLSIANLSYALRWKMFFEHHRLQRKSRMTAEEKQFLHNELFVLRHFHLSCILRCANIEVCKICYLSTFVTFLKSTIWMSTRKEKVPLND